VELFGSLLDRLETFVPPHETRDVVSAQFAGTSAEGTALVDRGRSIPNFLFTTFTNE